MDLRQANLLLEARQLEIEQELLLAERVQQTLASKSLTWCGGSGNLLSAGASDRGELWFGHSVLGIPQRLALRRFRPRHRFCAGCQWHLHGNDRTDSARSRTGAHASASERLRVAGLASEAFYFTLAAARLKSDGRILEFAGAGHPPAMLVRPGEKPQLLKSQSSVLGLIENAVGNDATIEVPLQSGARLVIYTDGFTESFNSSQGELAIDAFSEIVRETSLWPLPEMKQHILDRVAAFRSGPPADDMSLVVVGMLSDRSRATAELWCSYRYRLACEKMWVWQV
jgi:hypothetical protein